MMIRFLQLLILLLIGSDKHEPVYDLHKKQEPINLQGFNWTFILLTLAMVLFFVFIWIFQLGNSYPNELMSNL
jgi:hypothetical protein